MNRNQALAKLRPILGKQMGYREDRTAAVGEARDQLRASNIALQERKKAAKEALEARRIAVLAADAAFQSLLDAYTAVSAECEKAPSSSNRRITVGIVSPMFFSVRAEGDNWAEVVEALTAKGR